MIRLGDTWAKGVVLVLFSGALAGCDRAPPPPPKDDAECGAIRDLGRRSLERWVQHNDAAPPPEAPISAAAAHTEGLARTAREIGAEFVKAAPKRADLAETAQGAKMLGDLAGEKLEAMARSVRDIDARVAALTKIESGANDAVDKIGRDAAKDVGCDGPAAPGCADVGARLADLKSPRVPAGFGDAAVVARARADTLDALAKAIEALPPVPAKQVVRDDAAKHAREGAAGFRALSKALAEAAVPQDRLPIERQEASEAATRLTAELEAAAQLCGGKLPPPKPAPTGK